jgi:hemolysin activation/secretion protein
VGIGRVLLAALLWLAASAVAFAQLAPPSIPQSEQPGRLRERFTEPQAPLAEPAGRRIALPSTVAPEGAEKIRLKIRAIVIEGATVYRPEDLALLYRDMVGQEVTLTAVYDLAQRITAKYGTDGYVLSRAIVPPQNLAKGGATIHIQVIEGYVDKVVWPTGLERFRDFFSYYAAKIMADRPTNVRTMERYLLLAGELPGLKFSTSLKASEKNPNAATLFVEVVYKPLDVLGRIDNRGTPARGPLQYLGSLTANNLFGTHDAFTFSYASVASTRELTYLAGSYRQVLTAEGLTAFVDASDGYGKPGTRQLELLQFKTKTLYGDAGLSYPFLRSREENLIFSGLMFASDSTSDVLGAPFNNDRLRGFRFKTDFDMADSWRGINQVNLVTSQGIDGLDSTTNNNPLASRLPGRVDFTKFETTVSRTQPLFAPLSAYISGYSQYSSTSLLSPEQCSFGGRFFGRAFDPSELLGDTCLMGNAELRYDMPSFWSLTQIQFYGFTDGAELFNRAPGAGFPSWTHAASAGGGVRLGWLTNINADLTVAKAIDGPRDDTRFFFAVTGKY